MPGARAYGSAIAIFSLATQRASRRPYLMLLPVQDASKTAVTTLELVPASEGAATSLQMIALALSTLLFEP